ncbi:hypothetical protein B0I35DRAFT_442030 [Stachybotrys elegans]|uniref:Secreted protein n=1 Tax=Stachybotrys elegans TaxID=80388 RepID=A0A8K0SLZ7_9HYPO|nr:hypothetical protein B0I35DRAFT_442030 [Stachybotrys elegans]
MSSSLPPLLPILVTLLLGLSVSQPSPHAHRHTLSLYLCLSQLYQSTVYPYIRPGQGGARHSRAKTNRPGKHVHLVISPSLLCPISGAYPPVCGTLDFPAILVSTDIYGYHLCMSAAKRRARAIMLPETKAAP